MNNDDIKTALWVIGFIVFFLLANIILHNAIYQAGLGR